MTAVGLVCTGCAAEYALKVMYRCDQCRFPLRVRYDTATFPATQSQAEGAGIWRYAQMLPPVAPENRLTLGEGNTPLIPVGRRTSQFDGVSVLVKHEGLNPTGSFKDRAMAVGVSMAREAGIPTVVSSTTGNAGIALAAYAAAGGLDAVVLAAEAADPRKLGLMAAYGARVVRVKGSVSDAFRLGVEASREWGWMNLATTFLNPFSVEGHRTVAYEIVEQLGHLPDYVLVPVSVGPLLVGSFYAFGDYADANHGSQPPRMVAVQAAECAPIVRAYESGEDRVSEWTSPTQTVAAGIADPLIGYAEEGTYTLRVIRASKGSAIACDEQAIHDAQLDLAVEEGLLGEPTGTVGMAAVRKLIERGDLPAGATVVVIMTGSGARQPPEWAPAFPANGVVDAALDALQAALPARSI